jgi:hypothetical protein
VAASVCTEDVEPTTLSVCAEVEAGRGTSVCVAATDAVAAGAGADAGAGAGAGAGADAGPGFAIIPFRFGLTEYAASIAANVAASAIIVPVAAIIFTSQKKTDILQWDLIA